jgi:hypothetical protein
MAYNVGVDISIKTIGRGTVAGYDIEDNLQWTLPSVLGSNGVNYLSQAEYTAYRRTITLAPSASITIELAGSNQPLGTAAFNCSFILGYALHNTGLYASSPVAGDLVVTGTTGLADTVKPGCLSCKFFPLDASYVAGGYDGGGDLIITNSSASVSATGLLILYGNPSA